MRARVFLWISLLIPASTVLPIDAAPPPATAEAAPTAPSSSALGEPRAAVDRLVADYTGLYAGPTLDQWKKLFHPSVLVVFPSEDGSIRVLDLPEFFTRQKNYFATGRKISERLENVRVDMGRRIARVSADFIFMDEGKERSGKLGLHLAEGKDGWEVVAVLFAYDAG